MAEVPILAKNIFESPLGHSESTNGRGWRNGANVAADALALIVGLATCLPARAMPLAAQLRAIVALFDVTRHGAAGPASPSV